MRLLQVVLNWLSQTLGFDLQFDGFGTFLFVIVVVVPLGAMGVFFQLARKHRRPVFWVAAVPLVWWVVPIASFALREPLELMALPLLGIALGGAGFVGLFVLVGGNEEIAESQQAVRETVAKNQGERDASQHDE